MYGIYMAIIPSVGTPLLSLELAMFSLEQIAVMHCWQMPLALHFSLFVGA